MTVVCKENVPRYLTGCAATAISLSHLFFSTDRPAVLLASIFFVLICVNDTLFSRIPNLCNLALFVTGFAYHAWVAGPSGLLTAFLGSVAGLCLLLFPFLLGGVGGGDVKALGALGALLGPVAVFQVFLYVALFGAVLSLLHYAFAHDLREKCRQWLTALGAFAVSKDFQWLRPETSEKLRFPYAAAIACGFFAYVHWGGIL